MPGSVNTFLRPLPFSWVFSPNKPVADLTTKKSRPGHPGAAWVFSAKGAYSLTTSAFSMITGTTGTFSWKPLVIVGTALMASTTSWPEMTLPNTA